MSVALANGVCTGSFVVLARQESIDDARSNAVRAQQHDHRRGKVFAVTGPHVEEKIRKWIRSTGFHVERIRVIPLKVQLDRFRGVVTIARVCVENDSGRKRLDTSIEILHARTQPQPDRRRIRRAGHLVPADPADRDPVRARRERLPPPLQTGGPAERSPAARSSRVGACTRRRSWPGSGTAACRSGCYGSPASIDAEQVDRHRDAQRAARVSSDRCPRAWHRRVLSEAARPQRSRNQQHC